MYDDGGYVARIGGREYSTQCTGKARVLHADVDRIALEAPFHAVPRTLPTPARFILLRLLNLTVMRWPSAGNVIKRLLVRMLITRKSKAPLSLWRELVFGPDTVRINDVVRGRRGIRLDSLRYGAAFRGVHMASAGYSLPVGSPGRPRTVDVQEFAGTGELRVSTVITTEGLAGSARESTVKAKQLDA